jgi:hypothetical protein
MSGSNNAVIGFKPGCGCPTFAMVLGYETQKQEERAVATKIKQGYTMKVMPADEARKLDNFLSCSHKPTADDPEAVARAIVAAHRPS